MTELIDAVDIPFLEPDVIEQKAHGLCERAFGRLPDGPVDLHALVYDFLYEQHGVAFYNDRPLGEDGEHNVLGMTYPLKNEIHVDGQLATSGHSGRYRFTVAHEIGHWVLHRPLFVEAADGDDEPRLITLQRDVEAASTDSPDDYRPEEWQANYFAIHLLLNDRALDRAYRMRFGAPPRRFDAEAVTEFETMREFSRHLAIEEIDEQPSLANYFRLSAEATAIALEERGYVVDAVNRDES